METTVSKIDYSTPEESRLKKSSSIRGILSLAGQSSCGSTRNALARQSNSKSETQRNCVSIFASVSRLKSHPQRRQRAASIGCERFCWSRNLRICGPTMFRKFFMFRFQNRNANRYKFSMVRNTERFDLLINVGFEKFGGKKSLHFVLWNYSFTNVIVSQIEEIL